MEHRDERVVVVAPAGRDARVLVELLGRASIDAVECAPDRAASECLEQGMAVFLLTTEALDAAFLTALLDGLAAQPAWSDVPVLLLADPEPLIPASERAVLALRTSANMTVLERPVRALTLVTAVQSALRARRRQYEIRDLVQSERAARETAETASRLKDEFLATVSHELRTPLSSISLWARLMARGGLDEDKTAKGLAAIEQSAKSQSRLVEDLLDVARLRAGNFRLAVGDVDLASVLGEAVEVIRPAADAKQIHLDVRIEPVGTMRADSSRLQQVIWNLMSNAVKFTPREGRITIRLSARDEHVVLEVTDTGEGINPAFLPFVFDRFRQGDARVQREHGGLGLGLAITRQLVELHGGSIRAESEGRGYGARFVVELPIARRTGLHAAQG